jgi:superfamily II DNA/RNA helicase
MLHNLVELGFAAMTPVQAESLPHILQNRDVLAQAKTGSGKTAAFGLGLLTKLDVKKFRVQSLVLCPTRELADQVAKSFADLLGPHIMLRSSLSVAGWPLALSMARCSTGRISLSELRGGCCNI